MNGRIRYYNPVNHGGITMAGNCENCVFRQLEGDPERVPESMASALEFLSGIEEEPTTPEETAKVMGALEASACPVEGCRVSIAGLLRYVTSFGAIAPRQELDAVVAPGCALLDITPGYGGAFHGDPDSPLA